MKSHCHCEQSADHRQGANINDCVNRDYSAADRGHAGGSDMDDLRTLEAEMMTLVMLAAAAAVHWWMIWADHEKDSVIGSAKTTQD